MRNANALFVALCAAIAGSSLGFVGPALVRLPVLWYYPLARRFGFGMHASGLAMDWYGRVLLSAVTGLVCFAVASLVLRVRSRPSSRVAALWLAVALVAVASVTAVYARELVGRRPVPEPLPAGYVPQ